MATNKVLNIFVYKRKHQDSFFLRVENDIEIFTESVKVYSPDGMIENNTVYDLEKIFQKIITSAKKKVDEKVINWSIHFNQESFISCEFGSRYRIYKISEEEIDVIYKMIRTMDEVEH